MNESCLVIFDKQGHGDRSGTAGAGNVVENNCSMFLAGDTNSTPITTISMPVVVVRRQFSAAPNLSQRARSPPIFVCTYLNGVFAILVKDSALLIIADQNSHFALSPIVYN